MKDIVMFYPYISDRARERVSATLRGRWVGEGPRVKELEEAASKRLGASYVLAVITGTAALHLALEVAGVERGDEVIASANTCTATNHVILQVGAKPVFADIQYDTGNLDPNDIVHRITPRTKAIMVVHWGGYPPDLDEINAIARRYGLAVIEDAAQAFGATYKGKPVGNHSRFTCFSLQAIKVLTGVEGGLMTFQDMRDYGAVFLKRWYSIDKRSRWPNKDGYYDHDILTLGYKYNYNDVFASIALGNLEDFDERLERRRRNARFYRGQLSGVDGIRLFTWHEDRRGSNYLFTMHVERRADFIRALKDRGIEAGVVHYRNDLYTLFGGRRHDLPALDRYEKTYVSIPIHDYVTPEDAERIVSSICRGW